MCSDLRELQRLTRTQNAVLRITVNRGMTRASWKVPGRRAEIVSDLPFPNGEPGNHVEAILVELLYRLGLRDVPTTASLVEQMNPAQLQRARALIAEMNLLKAEVRKPIRARHIEPVLEAPRSSLDRRVVQGELS
jgi:hypothetical protein